MPMASWGNSRFPYCLRYSSPNIDSKQRTFIKRALQLAQTIIEELVTFGFKIELVLADSLYGESHPFVRLLDHLNLPWIVAIRKGSWGVDAGRGSG